MRRSEKKNSACVDNFGFTILKQMLAEQNISNSKAEAQLAERAQWNMNSYMDVLNKRIFGTATFVQIENSRALQVQELLSFLHT